MIKKIDWMILGGLLLSLVGCLTSPGFPIATEQQRKAPQVKTTSISSNNSEGNSLIAQPAQKIVLGYYTGEPLSYTAIQSYSAYLTMVSVDVFTVQSDGSISGSDDLGVVELDRSQGIQTFACISNYNDDPIVNDFDSTLAHAAILTHREPLIDSLVNLALEGGYAGINIDFENLAYSADIEDDRSAFTLFIQDLAERLHAESLGLIISVPGKMDDSLWNTWAYPFDLAALGEAADYLQLMTYDQHGPWSEPGAVAGADWVEECLRYTTSLVDPSKLLIGLPAYGYDWDLSASDLENEVYTASDFSWIEIPALLAKSGAESGWDPGSLSPFVTYTENEHEHAAWFENAESIRIKTSLVQQYNLAGLSMWALGKEDESFWQAAMEGLK
jgi:spore germination protein YaaH